MPLGVFPILLVIAILTTLASAYYLLINARTVATLFRSPRNEMAPGAGPTRPVNKVLLALIFFFLGSASSVALWVVVMTGGGNAIVETHPEEVQRP